MNKFTLPAIIIVLIIIGAYFLLGKKDNKGKQSAETPVLVIKTKKETIFDEFDAVGNTNSLESVNITANVTEPVREIKFTDGQTVKQGDVLVELDHNEELAQLQAASAEVKEQEREISRTESLLKNKAATKKELDERITLLDVAKNRLNEVQAKINDRIIKAPFDGVLGLRNISVGTLVQPGGLITTIDNITQIKVDFNVPAIYLKSLKTGMPVSVNIEALGKVFTGEVSNIDSRVSTETRTVTVRAVIPNENGSIKPGLVATVTMMQDKRESILVPEESITQRKDTHSVFVVNAENVINKREVKVGTRIPGKVEIIEGLNEGELVVARGLMQVNEGKKVSAEIRDFGNLNQGTLTTPQKEQPKAQAQN
jgi:membrane fusion protein (multidrug efflux system)